MVFGEELLNSLICLYCQCDDFFLFPGVLGVNAKHKLNNPPISKIHILHSWRGGLRTSEWYSVMLKQERYFHFLGNINYIFCNCIFFCVSSMYQHGE